MSKRNANGFIKLDHELLRCAAWQALSAPGIALLIDLWSRHNGHNNGTINYSVTEAQRRLKCGRRQAIRYLKELQDKGFIVSVQRGCFSIKTGQHRGTQWRLTMEACNGQPPTRQYLNWTPQEA